MQPYCSLRIPSHFSRDKVGPNMILGIYCFTVSNAKKTIPQEQTLKRSEVRVLDKENSLLLSFVSGLVT